MTSESPDYDMNEFEEEEPAQQLDVPVVEPLQRNEVDLLSMSVFNFSEADLPRFNQGMSVSYHMICPTSRTTTCDVMCLTNTYYEKKTDSSVKVSKTTDKILAALPYANMDTLNKILNGNTDFTLYRTTEIKERKGLELKLERQQYLQRIQAEKQALEKKQIQSAILIQAIFRGFRIRNQKHPVQRVDGKRQFKWIKIHVPEFEVTSFHNELCDYANALGLKPIHGLTLESYESQNRRLQKIEFAATLRLQCFFRMSCCLIKAKKRLNEARSRKREEAVRTIQNFARWILKKTKQQQDIENQKSIAVVKMQTRFRMFLAQKRVRILRKERRRHKITNDAATIIQRSLYLRHKPAQHKINRYKQRFPHKFNRAK